MCLGVPGQVLEISGIFATVDFWGVKRQVRIDICDEEVAVGDYVLNHVGFAIRRIPDSEVAATLELFDQLLAAPDEDLMLRDVRSEIDATGESHDQ
jgi:hydrogenase expression/formation protein HypC